MSKITPPPSDALFVCDICGRTYNQSVLKMANQAGYPVRTVCSYPVSDAAPTGGCFETANFDFKDGKAVEKKEPALTEFVATDHHAAVSDYVKKALTPA